MELIRQFILPILYAYIASTAFSLLLQIRGKEVFFAGIGGGLSWGVYLFIVALTPGTTDVLAYMLASVSIALFSEIMAIVRKKPALIYNTASILPIVPGATIMRTMEYLIQGDIPKFTETGLYSIQISGAIAIGILVGSSGFRMVRRAIHHGKRSGFRGKEAM